MAYDAFLSYSHAADGRLAPRLQAALQRFAKPWYRRRAVQVFRDETGLSASPGLWSSIVAAMDDAEHFILLASPDAAASPWVNREIAHWLASKSAVRILPVVTDGEWAWDTDANDFDADRSSAVPGALLGAFTEEPRHVDMRWARTEEDLSLRHSRFRDQVAELAAPLHGSAKDELEGEDVRQHRRTLRVAWGAGIGLASLTVAAVVAASLALSNAALARRSEELAGVEQARAERNAEQAQVNEAEAQRQEQLARDNLAEAQRQEQLARDNLAEAQRQEQLARDNLAEARRQEQLAVDNAAEADRQRAVAEDNERRAQTQRALAGANAERATANAAEASRQHDRAETEARIATSRFLASQARLDLDARLDRALLLAVQAHDVQPSSEARGALLSSLVRAPHLERFLHGSGQPHTAVAVSPDDALVAAGAADGSVVLWDARTGVAAGAQLANRGGTAVRDLAFAPDGSLLAVAHKDGTTAVWDLRARRLHREWRDHEGAVRSVAFDAGGGVLASGGDDGRVVVRTTATGRRLHRLPPVGRQVLDLRFQPGTSTLVAGLRRGRAVSWDLTTGAGPTDLLVGFTESNLTGGAGDRAAVEVAIGPRAATFAQGYTDGAVELWDLASGTTFGKPDPGPGPPWVSALAFSADGARLVSATDEVQVWDARTGGLLATHDSAHDGPITGLALDATGERAFSSGRGGRVGAWNLVTPATPVETASVLELDLASLFGAIAPPAGEADLGAWFLGAFSPLLDDVQFLPSGRAVAATSGDEVHVWDVASGARLLTATVPGLSRFPRGLAVHPDRSLAAAATDKGEILVLDLGRGGAVVRRIEADVADFGGLLFSADGSRLVAGTRSGALVWETETWRRAGRYGNGAVGPVALAANGAVVALAPDPRILVDAGGRNREIEVWDVAARTRTHVLRGHTDWIVDLAFRADGRQLASASDDGTVTLWDVTSGRRDGEPLRGLDEYWGGIAFSPGGDLLAMASTSRLMLVDADTRTPLSDGLAAGFSAGVTSVAFAPDDSALAFSDGFGVHIWPLAPDKLAAHACSVANRNLTRTEWSTFLGDRPYRRTCPDLPAGR